MKLWHRLQHPYLLAFFLPVALVVLLAGGLNWLSFLDLRNEHRLAVADAMQDQSKLKRNRDVNNEMAELQFQATELLERAGSGKIDQPEAYRIHSQLVNRLVGLEQQVAGLKDVLDEEDLQHMQKDLRDYRSAILQATDLAVINPSGALRHANQATFSYLHLSQKVRAVAAGLNAQMERRSLAREQSFNAHAIQTNVIAGALVLILMLA